MSTIEPQILINAGLFVGGLLSGAYSALKIRSLKNGNGNGNGASIEKSKKTSGALHISEEGLEKITEIDKRLEDKYLTEKRHTDVCASMQSAMKLYISEQLKTTADKILAAINKP